MLSTIFERVLLCALGLCMAIGIGTSIYAVLEHSKVTAAVAQVETYKLQTAQAEANAAVAASEAAATKAAFAAQAVQLATAQQNHAASTANLAKAVSANPSAASTEVSKDIWDAIYGTTPNATK
jgi:hypothetical protein